MTPASAAIDALPPVQTVWGNRREGRPCQSPRECAYTKEMPEGLRACQELGGLPEPRVRQTTTCSIESLCLPGAVLPIGDSNDAVVPKLILQTYRRCERKP